MGGNVHRSVHSKKREWIIKNRMKNLNAQAKLEILRSAQNDR